MSKYSVYGELPFDEAEVPKKTEYECDVLVSCRAPAQTGIRRDILAPGSEQSEKE